MTDYLQSHAPSQTVLLHADVSGFGVAFLVGAVLAGLGLLATLTMIPRGVAPSPSSGKRRPNRPPPDRTESGEGARRRPPQRSFAPTP